MHEATLIDILSEFPGMNLDLSIDREVTLMWRQEDYVLITENSYINRVNINHFFSHKIV